MLKQHILNILDDDVVFNINIITECVHMIYDENDLSLDIIEAESGIRILQFLDCEDNRLCEFYLNKDNQVKMVVSNSAVISEKTVSRKQFELAMFGKKINI